MDFYPGVLDILMMYGAYSTSRRLAISRIFLRFLWFSIASASITFLYVYVFLAFLSLLSCFFSTQDVYYYFYLLSYRKALQEGSNPNAERVMFRLYVIVIGIYGGVQLFLSILMRIPAFHLLTNQCDRWPLVRFFKWMRQVSPYNACFFFCSFLLVQCGLLNFS